MNYSDAIEEGFVYPVEEDESKQYAVKLNNGVWHVCILSDKRFWKCESDKMMIDRNMIKGWIKLT